MITLITLRYRGSLAELTGKKAEQMDAANVAEVISYIKNQYGNAAAKQAERMLITVNGTGIQLLGRFKTPLADGDVVAFLPLAAGG